MSAAPKGQAGHIRLTSHRGAEGALKNGASGCHACLLVVVLSWGRKARARRARSAGTAGPAWHAAKAGHEGLAGPQGMSPSWFITCRSDVC